MSLLLKKIFVALIFPNFVNFNRFGEKQYLKSFLLSWFICRMLISADEFFRINLTKVIEISHLSSYLLHFANRYFLVIKNCIR